MIQDLDGVGELLGAIATVVTLAYLATQIRRNTTATQSAAAQAGHESFSTWFGMLPTDGMN